MAQLELPLGERPLRNVESFESVARGLRAAGLGQEIDRYVERRKRFNMRVNLYIGMLAAFGYALGAIGLVALGAWLWGCFVPWDLGFSALGRDYGLMVGAILFSGGALVRYKLFEDLLEWHTRRLNRTQEQEEAICRSAKEA